MHLLHVLHLHLVFDEHLLEVRALDQIHDLGVFGRDHLLVLVVLSLSTIYDIYWILFDVQCGMCILPSPMRNAQCASDASDVAVGLAGGTSQASIP